MTIVRSGFIRPPMEVREKDVLVCRKIWSMKEGFTVVLPLLKVANCRSALEESSLELREERGKGGG